MTGTPVVVFDLDGTILRVNSFPRWVLFLIAGRVPRLGPHRRALLSLRTVSLLLRRKLAGASHEDFLWRLQGVWRSACARPDAPAERFETKLLRLVRPNMASVLELVATERIDAVLATAAAEDYAVGLGRRLGFRHVLATASNRRHGEPANAGARKREQVLALLDACGWRRRPLILFTDHLDDLPLMRDSSDGVLVRSAARVASGRLRRQRMPGSSFCGDLNGGDVARQSLRGLSVRPIVGECRVIDRGQSPRVVRWIRRVGPVSAIGRHAGGADGIGIACLEQAALEGADIAAGKYPAGVAVDDTLRRRRNVADDRRLRRAPRPHRRQGRRSRTKGWEIPGSAPVPPHGGLRLPPASR